MNRILRKIIVLISLSAMLLPFTACSDYLDVSKEVSAQLTTEEVFNNPGYTRQWYNNIYNSISEYSQIGSAATSGFTGCWSSYCNETSSNSTVSQVMVSGFNAGNAPNHRWGSLYERIRQAMIFLKNAKPLGGDSDQSQLTESEINRMKTEAKFFMAYSYFSLFELYGPVPVLTEIADPGKEDLDYARVPIDEFIKHVDGILEDVINSGNLPATLIIDKNQDGTTTEGNERYNLTEMVRPTTVAAMALRAKLWVYAASPLFNGKYTETLSQQNTDGTPLFSPYDAGKWQTAKKHLEALFTFATQNHHKIFYAKPGVDGVVDPNQSVYELFQYYNDEILWATAKNDYESATIRMEQQTTPRDIYGGYSNVCITTNSVDAFFMNNGLGINEPGSAYTEVGYSDVVNVCNEKKRLDKGISNMFVNREPRFYAAVIYQGRSWHIQPTNKPDYTVRMAKGEPVGNGTNDCPRTGYFISKFKNRTLLNTGNYNKKWARPSILFRLSDFYLYYAEVCNEINPSDPNVITYLDEIRKRAGIPGYQDLKNSGKKNIIGNQELQRKAIQRERQVELLAEGQRYFDTRRWMICDPGQDADQSTMYGLNMNGYSNIPVGEPNSFFTRVILEKHAWRHEMYLYPIPLTEIQKSRLLVQNPNW